MEDRAASIRVVLADDHPIVLEGLEQLFRVDDGFAVVGRCRDGRAALEAVREAHPDVLVLDLAMPQMDGLALLRRLGEELVETRVVVLTAFVSDEELLEAIRLGAKGVVLKEVAPETLLEAVREVHAGGEWFEKGLGSKALRRLLQRQESKEEAGQRLTPRELEVARLVAEGLRNRVIAERLFISEGTVKIHLHNIYEKLGIKGRLELALYTRERGLL
jgi:DNA-binding NarL/FixJ family response regulator